MAILEIPQLCYYDDEKIKLVDKYWLSDTRGGKLTDCISPINLENLDNSATKVDLQFVKYGVEHSTPFFDSQSRLDFEEVDAIWTEAFLCRWLANHNYRFNINKADMYLYVQRIIKSLLLVENITLEKLVKMRMKLTHEISIKINECKAEACKKEYVEKLFSNKYQIETSYKFPFIFNSDTLPKANNFQVQETFQKDFLSGLRLGAIENDYALSFARELELNQNVKAWIKNNGNPKYSFRLPLPDGYFSPDFVVELVDGRKVIVCCHNEVNRDFSNEKRRIGEFWEACSNSQGLFLVVTIKDEVSREFNQQFNKKIGLVN